MDSSLVAIIKQHVPGVQASHAVSDYVYFFRPCLIKDLTQIFFEVIGPCVHIGCPSDTGVAHSISARLQHRADTFEIMETIDAWIVTVINS
jgi:hypothetical protein